MKGRRFRARRGRGRFGIALGAVLLAFFLPAAPASAATTLSFSPASGSYAVGKTFTVSLVVNAGQAINAAEATVRFPKETLEVASVSKSSSRFTLWAVEPSFANGAGTVTFSGGLPSPGFTGSGGKILSVTFRAKAAGTARLTLSGAQVLANDGEGTNVLSSSGTATYTITAPAPANVNQAPPPKAKPVPTISSSTHPDQNAWYQARTIAASWQAGADAKGYSATFDRSAGTIPAETSQGTGTAFAQTVTDDGVWYLHVRAQYEDGLSEAAHFAFRIDATPPDAFVIMIDRSGVAGNAAKVTFATKDAASGISRYELVVDGKPSAIAVSPALLENLTQGQHTVIIRAIDLAGNATEAQASFDVAEIAPPTFSFEYEKFRLLGARDNLPVLLPGAKWTLRGVAQAKDTIRIIVRSQESVFEFPIETIPDPQPIEPVPDGNAAWKIELDPSLSPGEHEIHVTRKDAQGQISPEGLVIRFRVVTNVVRIGSWLIPSSYVIALLGLVGFLLATILFLILWHRRVVKKLRRALLRIPHSPAAASQGSAIDEDDIRFLPLPPRRF